MKKTSKSGIIIAFSLAALSANAQHFSLSGRFPGLVDGAKVSVILSEANNHETVAKGVVKDGAFTVSGHLAKPTVCTLKIDDRVPNDDQDYPESRGTDFMADNVAMTVTVACFDSIPLIWEFGGVPMLHEKNVRVSGGKFQQEYQQWRDAVYAKNLAYELARNAAWQYQFGDNRPDKAHYDKAHEQELSDKEQTALEAYNNSNAGFAKAHPNYAISLYLQSQRLANCFRFTNVELDDMLALYKDNGDTVGYHDFKVQVEGHRRYARNTPYTDFAVQTPDGGEQNVSSALKKGQWNIIDFWASWCGPCRASIPLVKRMHEESPAVNIVSVSCDSKVDDWKRAMEEENMPWAQVLLSPDKAKAKVARDGYRLQFIPYLILIDKEGRVAYAANSAEEIISKLRALL